MALLRTGFDTPSGDFKPPAWRAAPAAPEEKAAGEGRIAPAKTPLPTGDLTKENFGAINKMNALFCKTMAKGAEMSFAIGGALFEIKMRRNQSIFWKDFVRDNFDFSLAAANSHIRMYERFTDCPGAVRDKTIAEINGGKERAKHEYNRVEEAGGGKAAWDDAFSAPPLSGAPLKSRRFEPVGGDSIWMYDRKSGMYGRAVSLAAIEAPRGMEKARRLLLESVQGALEHYYAALEAMDGG
ncbi:MAG: hypothetical protein LBL45_06170 [Treponema sp.]|nr:hypothetical protein [Treponema sp.]